MNSLITEVCWLARDITQHVLDAQVEKYSREDEPLQYLKELNCVPDFNRFGQYGEVRWRDAEGALSDVVPGDSLLVSLQKRIREQGLRLYLLRMTAAGEEVPGLTEDPPPASGRRNGAAQFRNGHGPGDGGLGHELASPAGLVRAERGMQALHRAGQPGGSRVVLRRQAG